MKKAVVALTLIFAVASCGGGTKKAQTGASPTGDYCTAAKALDAVDKNLEQQLGPSGSSAALKTIVEQLASGIGQIRAIVPAEIKTDFEKLIQAFGTLKTILSSVGYDLGKLNQQQAAQLEALFSSSDTEAASDRVDDYNARVCGIPKGGTDAQTQSDLRNALTAAKVFYTDNNSYAATADQLGEIEPLLDFGALAEADETMIGFEATAESVLFVERSSSGTYFCISDNNGKVGYGKGETLAEVNTLAKCSAGSW